MAAEDSRYVRKAEVAIRVSYGLQAELWFRGGDIWRQRSGSELVLVACGNAASDGFLKET